MAGWIINGVEFERPAGQRGAVFIYDGELWDTAEHGLFCTELTVGSPEVRQNKREALARDGFIDLTEQFGRPVFGNRTISWRFLVTEEDWATRCAEVRDFIADLHGRKVDILVDDYEGWTFTGRLALERVVHQLDGTYVEVTADCEPFRRDGSTYSLDSSPETYTLGPSAHIVPERDIEQYLENPGSYDLAIVPEFTGTIESGRVYAAYGSIMVTGVDSDLTFTKRVEKETTEQAVTIEQWLSPQFALQIPATGADVYAMVNATSAATPAIPSRISISKLSGSQGETEVIFDPRVSPGSGGLLGPVHVDSFGAYEFTGNRSLNYKLFAECSVLRMDFTFAVLMYAVPPGAAAPTASTMMARSTRVPQLLAEVSGEAVSGTPLVLSAAAVSGQSQRPHVISTTGRAVPSGASSAQNVVLPVTVHVDGVAVHDLSELEHRFLALTGTIPPASDPDDPEYIDIDGRRYYADEAAYTVKANAGYRSSVSVYGEGPVVTAEGLAI